MPNPASWQKAARFSFFGRAFKIECGNLYDSLVDIGGSASLRCGHRRAIKTETQFVVFLKAEQSILNLRRRLALGTVDV